MVTEMVLNNERCAQYFVLRRNTPKRKNQENAEGFHSELQGCAMISTFGGMDECCSAGSRDVQQVCEERGEEKRK